MNPDFNSDEPFRIGGVQIAPRLNQIAVNGKTETVEPRLIEVLCYLAARSGDVVSREDIIRNVWHVEYGADDSLSRAISILRKTFSELGADRGLIETIPRRGYRLLIAPSAEPIDDPVMAPPITIGENTDHLTSGAQERNSKGLSRTRSLKQAAPGALAFFLASAAYAIAGVFVWLGREPAAPPAAPPERSLAILPFTALTGSEADSLFAEGLAEEMMARLSIIEGLRMPGRTASRAFVGDKYDIRTIGEELGVNYILEGTVRRERDRMRINVDLSSTQSGYRLWSQSYDRAGDESLLIQEDIARRVANALSARFLDNGAELKSVAGTTSVRAFNLYLEGRRYLNMRGGAVARAIERFETALEEDPNFGLAAAGLASGHALSNRHLNTPKAIAHSRARTYVELAISIDDRLAEPYAVLGAIDRDNHRWTAAMARFEDALARDDSDLQSLHGQAETLLSLGFLDEARETLDRAFAIDPVSPVSHYLAGHLALTADNLDTADQYYQRAQALGLGGAVFDRGLVLFRRGEIEKAGDLLATAYVHYQLIPPPELESLSGALERLMRRESTVEAELRPFRTLIGDDDARLLAFLLAGETADALTTLAEDADGDHDGFHHIWTNLVPEMRSSKEFIGFLRETGLLEYWNANKLPDRCESDLSREIKCG